MKTPDIKIRGQDWLKSQGWKDISDQIDYILLQNKLEEYPYKPHALIQKGSQQFFVNFFNKEDYFYSKKAKDWVTGFEWYKYKLNQTLEVLTEIPTAVIFHNQLTDEFIFRQLNQLPNPIKWRASYCLAKRYKRYEEQFQCYLCWKKNPYTCHSCIQRKIKRRPMAVWLVDNFINKTDYQTQLFTKKYEIPKQFRTSIRTKV